MGVTAFSAVAMHPTLGWCAVATPSGDIVMWTDPARPVRTTVGHYRIDSISWSPTKPALAVDVDGDLVMFAAREPPPEPTVPPAASP